MHFHNKEELFRAALETLDQALTSVMNEAIAYEPDAMRKVPKSLEALFLFLAHKPKQAHILIESPALHQYLP